MARGDHIFVPRWRGMYTHHGIDIGDGTVVHFSGEPLRLAEARVERDTMEVFCGGEALSVMEYGEEALEAEAVVDMALSRVGERGYRLWHNNCEHFASYCKTGRPVSPQASRALRGLAVAASLTATVTVAGAAMLWKQRRRSES